MTKILKHFIPTPMDNNQNIIPVLTAESSFLRCSISKQRDGFVNVFTNFKPLSQAVFLLELDSSDIVDYLSNVAFYGDHSGGLSVKLKPGTTEKDLQTLLQELLNNHGMIN